MLIENVRIEVPASIVAPERATSVPATAPGPSGRTSIGGIRLGLWATWRAIVRAVGRLVGRP